MKVKLTNNELNNSLVAINRTFFSGEELDTVYNLRKTLSSGDGSEEGFITVDLNDEDIASMIIIISRGEYKGTELESIFPLKLKYIALSEKKAEVPGESVVEEK